MIFAMSPGWAVRRGQDWRCGILVQEVFSGIQSAGLPLHFWFLASYRDFYCCFVFYLLLRHCTYYWRGYSANPTLIPPRGNAGSGVTLWYNFISTAFSLYFKTHVTAVAFRVRQHVHASHNSKNGKLFINLPFSHERSPDRSGSFKAESENWTKQQWLRSPRSIRSNTVSS